MLDSVNNVYHNCSHTFAFTHPVVNKVNEGRRKIIWGLLRVGYVIAKITSQKVIPHKNASSKKTEIKQQSIIFTKTRTKTVQNAAAAMPCKRYRRKAFNVTTEVKTDICKIHKVLYLHRQYSVREYFLTHKSLKNHHQFTKK
jgi:hypothetical protein